jgi:phospholipase D1/2
VFGPALGTLYAFGGALVSAAVTFWIGNRLGRDTVRRLAGRRLNRITRRLTQKGVIAIAVIRLLPVAPFSIVNAVAGASHISLRDFMLGTMLGMFPGIVVTIVFVDRITKAILDPGMDTLLMLLAFAVLIVAAATFIHRRLVRTEPRPPRTVGD